MYIFEFVLIYFNMAYKTTTISTIYHIYYILTTTITII